MNRLFVGVLVLVFSLSIHAKTLFSIETDAGGKVASAFLPDLYDLEGFWASDEFVFEAGILQKAYLEVGISLLTPHIQNEGINNCFESIQCSDENQKVVLNITDKLARELFATHITYYGQGYEVTNTYLGIENLALVQMYEFRIESSSIFNMAEHEFTLRTQTYFCEEVFDGTMPWVKDIYIIKGLTPEPFNIELSAEVCKNLDDTT